MRSYARWLFGVSALTNFFVASGLLFFRGSIAPLVGLEPVQGTNIFLFNFTATMIGLFGYCYLRVAGDPVRFRPLIHITAIGKLLAIACAVVPWQLGAISAQLPAMLAADLVFAMLFFDYLRRTSDR